jgi:hypothetical protein
MCKCRKFLHTSETSERSTFGYSVPVGNRDADDAKVIKLSVKESQGFYRGMFLRLSPYYVSRVIEHFETFDDFIEYCDRHLNF